MTNGIGRVGWRNFVSPTTATNPLWNNLVAYYTGDNTPNDAKGTANGTLVNGATYGTGKIGSAFSFDGINDYVELGDVMDLGLNSRSFSIWFKASSSSGTLFSKSIAGPGSGRFSAALSGNKLGLFFNGGGGDHAIETTTTVNLNTWYNAVFIIDRNDKLKIYLNGVLQDVSITQGQWYAGTNNLISYSSVNYDNSFPFRIGSYNDYYGGAMSLFSGLLDEFGIWNRVLTDAEITELYNGGAGKQYVAPVVSLITTGLILNLDAGNALSYSGTGTTWTDLSGNGNNGTLLNGTAYSSENGGTLVLDGINDYAVINNGTGLNLGNEYTFSIWVKFNNFGAVLVGADMWDYYYLMYVDNSNNIYTRGSGGYALLSGVNITTNQWVCLTIVRSATSNTLYKNGVYIASGNPSNSGIVKAIGAYASGSYNLNGKISSVNAYNRSLSSTEVTQNFNATKTRFGL